VSNFQYLFISGCLEFLLYEDVFQDDIKTEVQAERIMKQFVEKVSKMRDVEQIVGEMRKSGRIPNDTMQFGVDEKLDKALENSEDQQTQ
jgi:uncharacterized spore protein YtfJ